MVVIEALGQGLPIVAFDCPRGARELVKDAHNGFLIPDGDVEYFGSALRTLMADENLRHRLGTNGRVDAEAFDIKRVVMEWEQLIDDVVPRHVSRKQGHSGASRWHRFAFAIASTWPRRVTSLPAPRVAGR